MIDMMKSHTIYNELMNGRIINAQVIDANGEFQANPLFSEVMDNFGDYRKQYEMCGFQVEATGEYIYVAKGVRHEAQKTDIAMKAYLLLIILGQYVTTNGFQMTGSRTDSKLSAINGGLSLADIEKIQAMPHTKEWLDRAGMGDDLLKNIKTILVERHIMQRNPVTENFILSQAGNHFFDENTHRYKSEMEHSHKPQNLP